MELEKLLRSGVLFDADKGGQGGGSPDDKSDPGNEPGDDRDKGGGGGDSEPKFTQEQVNAFIQDRLARERKKQEEEKQKEREEAERKRLEEEKQYKELADKLQKELEEQSKKIQDKNKETALIQAGYSEEQVAFMKEMVKGETDEEIGQSVEELKKAFPVKQEPDYVDPSAGNSKKSKPEKKDGVDVGKSAYERLKELGKIRRK